jgi:hypothetical protein
VALLIIALLCLLYLLLSAFVNLFFPHLLSQPASEESEMMQRYLRPSDSDPNEEPVLWNTGPDPDKAQQESVGCDWDCLKLLFN